MALGQPVGAFWRATPRLMLTVMEGCRRRLEREHNDRAWLAWHTAFLPRAKHLPDLRSLQVKPRKHRRGLQTWEEMRDTCRMITAAYGGRLN